MTVLQSLIDCVLITTIVLHPQHRRFLIMSSETIDHTPCPGSLKPEAVRGGSCHRPDGRLGVMIKYGMLERPLSATRSKKIRTFKKLETLVAYLKEIGIQSL